MNNKNTKSTLLIFGLPLMYAIILRFIYGIETWTDLYSVMSVTFLFFLPTIVGVLTTYLSSEERVKSYRYRILAPWVPVFAFVLITLAISWEGWACWLMVLPVFLIAASIGGLIGGNMKQKKDKGNMYITAMTFLPLLASPIEAIIGAIPGTYKAYTYIDIQAPAGKIWSHVTQVRKIAPEQDKGWLTKALGFPRPVSAELNHERVGGYREAIFTNGLVFHETVLEYIPERKMVFAIKAYPHEIPSTTMDEHVVIGGKYFDVLNGTYELEQLGADSCRLHLYSHFTLNTTFNFYASWWAKWIMQDIQQNILQVQKLRAERI